MEAIISYIENLFSTFPDTEEARRLKKSLLDSSQDRYHDLKNQGKSENEAVGAVISEFGGIDEIKRELNLSDGITNSQSQTDTTIYVDEKQATEAVEAEIKANVLVAIGVMFCILAPAVMIFTSGFRLIGESSSWPIGLLLILVGIGTAFFILSSSLFDNKTSIKKQDVTLSNSAEQYLKKTIDDFRVKKAVLLSVGILIVIISPLMLFFGSRIVAGEVAMPLMLVFISFGAMLIILSSEPEGICKSLLESKNRRNYYAGNETKVEKINAIFNSIIWPIAIMFFLIVGFTRDAWHPGWVVFPISGILSGIVGAVSSIFYSK